jgi:signal transduction histidine kinase/ligand-binding sensor domain-containing protein/DNA-binding response OmpR family regulator
MNNNGLIESFNKSRLCLLILYVVLLLPCAVWASKAVINFDNLSTEQGLNNPYVMDVLQDQQGFIWIATQDGLYRYDGYTFKAFKHDPQNPTSIAGNYVLKLYQNKTNGQLWVTFKQGGFGQYHSQTESFTNYQHEADNANSLSSNEVSELTQDPSGLLWIGTKTGLNQYNPDNDTFTHFRHDPAKTNSLSSDTVYTVMKDSNGDLWVGTDKGLNRLDEQTAAFTRYQHDSQNHDSLSGDDIIKVLQDNNGQLWVSTRDSGLNRLNPKTNKFNRFQHNPDDPASLKHNSINLLFAGKDGTFWVGTEGGGLSHFDPKTATFEHYHNNPDDPDSLSPDAIRSIFEDNAGTLWVSAFNGGLNRFDSDNKRFYRYQHDTQNNQSLANNRVYSITQDRTGLIWLGTFGGGVSKFDPSGSRFGLVQHNTTRNNSLSEGEIGALLEDKSGILWIGTETGLNRYDPSTDEFQHYQHNKDDDTSLNDNDIWSLYEDKTGILWVGTRSGGLNRFSAKTNTFIHFKNQKQNNNSLSDNFVFAIDEDKFGDLWIGTANGLNRYNPDSNDFIRFTHSADPSSLGHNTVFDLYTSTDGTLWVATDGGGLNRFNHQKQNFKRYQHQPDNDNSLSHNTVYSINQDAQGVFWIGSQGGLNQFNPATETFEHYRQKDGLVSDRVFAVLIDKMGKLWLGEEGITLFDPQTKVVKTHIGASAGCLGANLGAHFQASDGQLFFGSSGFCAFYPEQAIVQSLPPELVFTDFRLLNKSVPISNPLAHTPLTQVVNDTTAITLTHEQNILSFEFAALHYTDPKNNQYQYQLTGFNESWITTRFDNRRATYTNLSAGEYTFRVKASNHEGVWNEKGRDIKLHILPAPWQTWWAYAIYIALFISLIWAFASTQRKKILNDRAVIAQLKQVDTLKDEFLANTSHELRTPLNGIIGLAESLMDGVAGQLPDKANHNLAMVVSSGKRLANLVNDILDFSKLKNRSLILHTQSVDLHSMTDVVLTLSRPLMGSKKLKLVNDISEDLPAVQADEDRLQQILHNLVGNAIKFTEEGTITVSAVKQDGWDKVSVSDTGIGIAKDKFDAIFESFEQVQGNTERSYSGTGLGLAVSKQLVGLHGGTIEVDSTPGKGSTFSFTLPISQEKAIIDVSQNNAVARLHMLDSSLQNEVVLIQPSSNDGTGFKILLVDDESVNRQVLHDHLSMQNYQLVEAPNGQQALNAIEEQGPFDLVLLDIMMPKISGFEVCQKIREKYAVNDLPVIFLTAKNQVADLVQSFAVGANDYISKPVAKHELLTRVETHLRLSDINRNLERKVTERTAELEILGEIGKDLNASLNREAIFSRLYQHISNIVDAHVFAIGILDSDKGQIDFKLTLESGKPLPPHSQPLSDQTRLSSLCVSKGQEIVVNHRTDIANYVETLRVPTVGEQMASIVFLPLRTHEQRVMGCMTLQSPTPNAYTAAQLDILRTLASYTAIALDNANAYREVERKNKEILATQQKLVQSEKMASLGTLTAGVAHEINNPTNFVHVSAQILEDALSNFQKFTTELVSDSADKEILESFHQHFAPMHEHIKTIREGSQRIKIIVQDLSAFTQLGVAEQKAVDIAHCLQTSINLIQPQYLAVAEFATEFRPTPEILCYPAQINQVFMNLIVNACDAIANKQKQTNTEALGKITIGCQLLDNRVEITIKDNGCGMDEVTKSKLFEPFYTTKTVGEGTGLGLSISYGIVQKHGGELSVDSQLGVGTVFTLVLPTMR